MAHNGKVLGVVPMDGLSAINSSQLVTLDLGQFKSINGDDGGTWTPVAPLIVGGAGMAITTADAAEFTYKTARTLTRKFPMVTPGQITPGGGTGFGFGTVRGLANGLVITTPIEVPDGATITKIRMRLLVNPLHVAPPNGGPGISVSKLDITNVASLGPITLLTTDNGSGVGAVLTVGTLATYNALGNTFWDYVPNQNNVIDRSNFHYMIELFDEGGGGAISGNVFTGYEVTYTLPQLRAA